MAMLHLAQVQELDTEGKAKLQLLAHQKAEHVWVMLPEAESVVLECAQGVHQGMLLLVELTGTRQVHQVYDAKDWVLKLIEEYLGTGLSPVLLQEEAQRAEQWRQSLTLQSQELGRRSLELEARRDQIQELEENLKRERQQLEAWAAELKAQEKQQA